MSRGGPLEPEPAQVNENFREACGGTRELVKFPICAKMVNTSLVM